MKNIIITGNLMPNDIITPSEFLAWQILNMTPMATESFHDSADYVIVLAEKIKAERLTTVMLKP